MLEVSIVGGENSMLDSLIVKCMMLGTFSIENATLVDHIKRINMKMRQQDIFDQRECIFCQIGVLVSI